jgi:hypothetical protein
MVLKPARKKSAVLVCGADEMLLHYRGTVLERAGFDIETANTSAEAAQWLQAAPFRLVVLCHTLSAATRNAIQVLCWRSRVPSYDIPVLLPPERFVRAVADRTMTRAERTVRLRTAM